MTSETTTLIAELNDLFRTTFLTGRVLMTEGVLVLPDHVGVRTRFVPPDTLRSNGP